MQNKIKATTVLLICIAGAILTLPQITPFTALDSFTLNLINHGLLAATIGGLADWFAVTALFRKPLYVISWHSEILKRNRQRFMDAIVDFVSNDLLSSKNIINNIKSENTANLLIAYFEHNEGRKKIKYIINEILVEVATTIDTKTCAESLAPVIKSETKNINSEQIIETIIKVITKETYSRKLLSNIFEIVHNVFKSEVVQEAIKSKIGNLKKEYSADSPGREMVFEALNLSDEKILSVINENVERKMQGTIKTLNSDIVDPNTITTASNFTMYFEKFLKSITNDESSHKFFNDIKKVLANKFNLNDYLKNWLDKYLKSETYLENKKRMKALEENTAKIVKLEKITPVWQSAIEEVIEQKIDEFIASPILQDKFDRYVKEKLEILINNYHDKIQIMVRERLNALTDEELTMFVEERVAEDLQMIRINGSICGCVVGIILYLVSYGIKFVTGNL